MLPQEVSEEGCLVFSCDPKSYNGHVSPYVTVLHGFKHYIPLDYTSTALPSTSACGLNQLHRLASRLSMRKHLSTLSSAITPWDLVWTSLKVQRFLRIMHTVMSSQCKCSCWQPGYALGEERWQVVTVGRQQADDVGGEVKVSELGGVTTARWHPGLTTKHQHDLHPANQLKPQNSASIWAERASCKQTTYQHFLGCQLLSMSTKTKQKQHRNHTMTAAYRNATVQSTDYNPRCDPGCIIANIGVRNAFLF